MGSRPSNSPLVAFKINSRHTRNPYRYCCHSTSRTLALGTLPSIKVLVEEVHRGIGRAGEKAVI